VVRARDFFEALPLAVLPRLPIELRGFETARGHGRLLKFHYGRPQTHFEAWHHSGAARLEIGLHFEGPPPLNQAAFDFFRARMVEVKAGLPRAELEPWDKGWSRLYETLPAPLLEDRLLAEAGARMAAYITVLHPLLESFSSGKGG
jgi:hypothetical protein